MAPHNSPVRIAGAEIAIDVKGAPVPAEFLRIRFIDAQARSVYTLYMDVNAFGAFVQSGQEALGALALKGIVPDLRPEPVLSAVGRR